MKLKHSIVRRFLSGARILKFSGKRYVTDQLGQQAIVLTYYTLFSIVPLAALLFGIAKGFGLDRHLLEALYSRLPEYNEFVDHICNFADRMLRQSSGGVVAGVGVITLLWTVVWLINNIEKSFNMVWGLPPRKDVFRKFSSYLSLVLITPIMMVAISTFGMMLRTKLIFWSEGMPILSLTRALMIGGAKIAPVLASCILFFIIYMFVPNTKVRWRGALVAGIIAGICFQVLQDSFLLLQGSVFSYNRIYGGFAVLPLFLIWVNWSWQIILFGAEICFVHQHLKSGVFNENSRKMSQRLCREHQMAIAALVFDAFEKGNGPLAENEVTHILRLPDVVMRKEIGELTEKGILCRSVAEDGHIFLLPGLPPEKFTVIEFLNRIGGSGDMETPEFAKFEKVFAEMEKAVKDSGADKCIHKI